MSECSSNSNTIDISKTKPKNSIYVNEEDDAEWKGLSYDMPNGYHARYASKIINKDGSESPLSSWSRVFSQIAKSKLANNDVVEISKGNLLVKFDKVVLNHNTFYPNSAIHIKLKLSVKIIHNSENNFNFKSYRVVVNLQSTSQTIVLIDSADNSTDNSTDDEFTCTICLDKRATCGGLPCGHVFACKGCIKTCMENSSMCPLCRVDIETSMDIVEMRKMEMKIFGFYLPDEVLQVKEVSFTDEYGDKFSDTVCLINDISTLHHLFTTCYGESYEEKAHMFDIATETPDLFWSVVSLMEENEEKEFNACLMKIAKRFVIKPCIKVHNDSHVIIIIDDVDQEEVEQEEVKQEDVKSGDVKLGDVSSDVSSCNSDSDSDGSCVLRGLADRQPHWYSSD